MNSFQVALLGCTGTGKTTLFNILRSQNFEEGFEIIDKDTSADFYIICVTASQSVYSQTRSIDEHVHKLQDRGVSKNRIFVLVTHVDKLYQEEGGLDFSFLDEMYYFLINNHSEVDTLATSLLSNNPDRIDTLKELCDIIRDKKKFFS